MKVLKTLLNVMESYIVYLYSILQAVMRDLIKRYVMAKQRAT